ncbi:protein kinase [Chloropicon primus]|uniref:Protein kinase n=1 Tax=Chloropicon primus TaxID=1764295 RepID=A0A5B8MQ64_9CHLO|nr:protein kinase [Chloropicon primus]UPR01774.1 protein kinase [Chloropicon primus]|eukprot:QDZ22553.1 protein kinase [Chloropicon primus]
MDKQSVQVVGSLLFCPICSPQRSAEDAGYLYYPSDEEIPVKLCKYLYGYPRDYEERYETLEELGKGSFGIVHRIVDKKTGEFYAAKTLPKSRPTWTGGMDGGMRQATTSAYLLKIQAEVNFLARLNDVHEVVQLVKAYEDDSHVHLVMDLCTGGSLYEKMEERIDRCDFDGSDCFDEETVRKLMRSIINMLVSCHGRGIIYRDLKPQNFLYVDETPDSEIKCSDYGLAMSYIPSDPAGISLNKRAGTPVYMAPEVVLRRYDEKADLWSAGMLMYQLLGNKLPLWNGDVPYTANLDDIFFDTLLRDIDFDFIAEESSPEAADLCKKLLTRDPDKRMSAEQASQHPWLREE